MRFAALLTLLLAIGALVDEPTTANVVSLDARMRIAAGPHERIVSVSALPADDEIVTGSGGLRTELSYTLSDGGFTFSFGNNQDGSTTNITSSEASIVFVVDRDTDFIASGLFSVVSAAVPFVYSQLYTELLDLDSATRVFTRMERGGGGADPTYSVGQAACPPTTNPDPYSCTGALTGTLLAGHRYSLHYNAGLVPVEGVVETGPTGSGHYSFSLVPEPNTALLIGLGLMLIGVSRSRKTS